MVRTSVRFPSGAPTGPLRDFGAKSAMRFLTRWYAVSGLLRRPRARPAFRATFAKVGLSPAATRASIAASNSASMTVDSLGLGISYFYSFVHFREFLRRASRIIAAKRALSFMTDAAADDGIVRRARLASMYRSRQRLM